VLREERVKEDDILIVFSCYVIAKNWQKIIDTKMNKVWRSTASFFLLFRFYSLGWQNFFIRRLLNSVSNFNSWRVVLDVDGAFLNFFHEKFSVFLECILNLVGSFGWYFHKDQIVVFGKFCSLFIRDLSSSMR
jgi:hypothetical protein